MVNSRCGGHRASLSSISMGGAGVLLVSPAVVALHDVESCTVAPSVLVSIKNLDKKRSHSVCVKPPAAKRFAMRGMQHTERLAPGMEAVFEVLFDTTALEPGVDHHDKVLVHSDAGDFEVPLRALAPKPHLRLQAAGDASSDGSAAMQANKGAAGQLGTLLEFGLVPAGSSLTRPLWLVNDGSRPADWKAIIDGGVPLQVEPSSGLLEAGSSVQLLAKISAGDPGALSGELLIMLATGGSAGSGSRISASGGEAAQQQKQLLAEPAARCPVGANVVACTYEIRSESGGSLKEIDFGAMYMGERMQRVVQLFNGCPTEAHFDLSFGPATEMGPADASGPMGAQSDDPHASFLRLARIRAKAREEEDSAVRVRPLAGAVPAYSSTQLVVTFHPPAAQRAKGFASKQPEAEEEARLFDYVVQVDLSGAGGARPLRFPVRGCGLLPRLQPSTRLLHFGEVACGEWGDQLLTLQNACQELPVRVEIDKGSPYFQASPTSLVLPPKESGAVMVRYQPKAMGKHQAAISCVVVPLSDGSSITAGQTLAMEVVETVGSCLHMAPKVPLPGGPDATPETFTKQRRYVDEQDATIWALKQEQGKLPGRYQRPKLWETADNAQALDWIGPEDRFGVTKDIQVFRVQHADAYTSFIRAGRTAKARAHLTRKEGGEDDKNLGMDPYRGLSPNRVDLPKGIDPLWTVKPEREGGPSVAAKAPPSAALAAMPLFKEKPEGDQERADCSMELTPAELSSIQVTPKLIDFGKVSTAQPAVAHFVITNMLRRAMHVALDLARVPELAGTTPLSQVVPAGSTAKFPMVLRCRDIRTIREQCEFCINGAHFAPMEVAAEVVPVTLRLSADELDFAFGIDNWDNFVDKSLLMSNPHNFPVDYEWEPSSPAFVVTPASGLIKPKSTAEVVVRWKPAVGAAAAANAPAAAAQSAVEGPQGPKGTARNGKGGKAAVAGPAAASQQGAGAGGKAASDAGAGGTAAAQAAVGLVQSAVMTLRLKGGADMPQRVALVAELPGGCLKSKEKEVLLGAVPVGEPQTVVLQLKNTGAGEAAFRALPNPLLNIHPDRARCMPESVTEIELSLAVVAPGPWSAVLELEVRGGRPIKIPVKAEGVLPSVKVQEPSLEFPPTFVGSVARLPLTLANTTAVPATLVCDLTTLPDLELLLSRDAWASSGYDSCPVQKVGANGEMSTLGSKRVSRRMSSLDTQRAAHRSGEAGYKFIIHLKPSSSLAMTLAFRPSRTGTLQLPLPLVLHSALAAAPVSDTGDEEEQEDGSGSSAGSNLLGVPVVAQGVQPQLVLSKSSVDFGACIISRSQSQRASPYATEVYVRNNTEADVQVLFGDPSTEKVPGCLGVFALEPTTPFTLAPEEGMGVTVRFTPSDARDYSGTIPVFIHGDQSKPHLLIEVAGSGQFPRLTFDVPEVVLPPVPLGVRSWARFNVLNDGYDNLELRFRLPPDEGHLPLKVELPEGNLIGLAKDKLPVVVSFVSTRPISFTALLEFLDESGRCFSEAITGTSDNCTLTTQPFVEANPGRLPLQIPRCGPPLLQLDGAPIYELPWQDALGPVRCASGMCRYLSAVTCKPYGPDLWKALGASKGKLLLELVEVLGGKAVSVKSAKSTGNKVDAVWQLLSTYDAVLTHLKVHGGLVNAVKPELLLEGPGFDRVMEARNAAAAGDPAQEEALEASWSDVEARFDELSARAWNTVVLQLFKIFVLARVTPQALRAMPGMEQATTAAAALTACLAAAAAASQKPPTTAGSASRATTAKGPATRPISTVSKGKVPPQGAAQAQQPAELLPDLGPADIPGDDVLTGSNFVSTAEACLLSWLNVNMARAFPDKAACISNFDFDLRDGVALFACLVNAWPRFAAREPLIRVHPNEGQEVRQNAELVVRCLEDLALPYEVAVSDLINPEPQNLMLLVLYLFQALPQLVPKATVEFTCKLNEPQVRDIELSNPSRKLVSYAARLEGHNDFGLEATSIKAEPGRTARLSVRCNPTTAIPREALLVLQARRDGGTPAASLVFQLRSCVRTRAPLKKVEVAGPLYEMAQFEVHVVNPFPADCDLTVSILHEPPEDDQPQQPPAGGKKGTQPAKSAANGSGPKGQQQAGGAAGAASKAPVFADPFGIDRPRIRLRAGAGDKLKGLFLPFTLGTARATLVFKDAECGEFCYELEGTAGQPAVFLEHKAVVAQGEGTQVVDLVLPFVNHQLEVAKRTYMEKHPLGRDKGQLARLRQDVGRPAAAPAAALRPPPGAPAAAAPAAAAASGGGAGQLDSAGNRPDRLLEYTVASSSSLVSVSTALVLHSGGDAAGGEKQHAGDHGQGGSGGAAAGKGASGGAASAGKGGPGINALRLSMKPLGTGVYPATLTLTSAFDVRVVSVEISAQVLGQSYSLELECPARQQAAQDIPLVNTGDAGMSVQATLTTTSAPGTGGTGSGNGGGGGERVPQAFSGPREVSVPPGGTASYPLAFRPLAAGSYTGRLELFIPATGERNVYNLTGRAGEPLEEGHLLVECQARCPVQRRLQVPNLLGTLPLAYNVLCDLDCLEGPEMLQCTSTRSMDNYKFMINPLRSGTFMGTLSFVAPDGNYTWFSIEVRASPPPEAGTFTVSCPVRRAVAISIPVSNPSDKPLVLRAAYSSPSLVGPGKVAIPPGAQDTPFECYFAPLVEGEGEAVVRLVGEEAGEFWWRIHTHATPGGSEELPQLAAPLGRCATTLLTVTNPLGVEAAFTAAAGDPGAGADAVVTVADGGRGGSGGPCNFRVSPAAFTLGPYASTDLQVEYRPCSLGVEERACVTVTSSTAGALTYAASGKGLMPGLVEQEGPTEIYSMLTDTSTKALTWVNPLPSPATVKVTLESPGEAPGLLSIIIKHPGASQAAPAAPAPLRRLTHGRTITKSSKDIPFGTPRQQGAGATPKSARRTAADAVEAAVVDSKDSGTAGAEGGAGGSGSGGFVVIAGGEPVTIEIPAGGSLQLPVSFSPILLKEAAGKVAVELLKPDVQAPVPVVWVYAVRGVPQADTRGVSFSMRCKARQRVEQEVWLPLPGLPPQTGDSPSTFSLDISYLAESHSDHELTKRLMQESALKAELLSDAPVVPVTAASGAAAQGGGSTGSGGGSGGAGGALASAPQLRARLVFEPRRALAAAAEVAVVWSGGSRWAFKVELAAVAPDVDGVLTLEAYMGRTAEHPLTLYSSTDEPEEFSVEFTPESPLCFDVRPAKGMLPVMPLKGGTQAAFKEAEGTGQRPPSAKAPITVLYTCKEMGRVLKGRLVVHTASGQHVFNVIGRMPKYLPPDPSAIRSTLNTGRGSQGRDEQQQQQQRQRSSSSAGEKKLGVASPSQQRSGSGRASGGSCSSSGCVLGRSLSGSSGPGRRPGKQEV